MKRRILVLSVNAIPNLGVVQFIRVECSNLYFFVVSFFSVSPFFVRPNS